MRYWLNRRRVVRQCRFFNSLSAVDASLTVASAARFARMDARTDTEAKKAPNAASRRRIASSTWSSMTSIRTPLMVPAQGRSVWWTPTPRPGHSVVIPLQPVRYTSKLCLKQRSLAVRPSARPNGARYGCVVCSEGLGLRCAHDGRSMKDPLMAPRPGARAAGACTHGPGHGVVVPLRPVKYASARRRSGLPGTAAPNRSSALTKLRPGPLPARPQPHCPLTGRTSRPELSMPGTQAVLWLVSNHCRR